MDSEHLEDPLFGSLIRDQDRDGKAAPSRSSRETPAFVNKNQVRPAKLP